MVEDMGFGEYSEFASKPESTNCSRLPVSGSSGGGEIMLSCVLCPSAKDHVEASTKCGAGVVAKVPENLACVETYLYTMQRDILRCKNEVIEATVNSQNSELKEALKEGSEGCDCSNEGRFSFQESTEENESRNFPNGRNNSTFPAQHDKTTSCCGGEESVAAIRSHPSHACIESNCPNCALASEVHISISDAINTKLNGPCNSADTLGNVNAGESATREPAPLLVFRRRNPKRAASSQNTQNQKKSYELNRTRNCTARKSRKGLNRSASLLSNVLRTTNKVTKRRSCVRRQVLRSTWGSVEMLFKFFMQKSDFSTSASDPTQLHHEHSNKRSFSCSRRQQTIRKNRSLRLPKTKITVSVDPIHANDEMRAQPIYPTTIDLLALSLANADDCMPNSCCCASVGVSEGASKFMHLAEDRLLVGASLHHVQQLDRDMESTLTEETSLVKNCLESSQPGSESSLKMVNGKDMLDPGSSPDSIVYHPVMDDGLILCQSNTGATQEVVLCDNSLVSDLQVTIKADGSPLSVSALHLEPLTNFRRQNNRKNNIELSGQIHTLAKEPFSEEKLQYAGSTNISSKQKSLRMGACRKQHGSKERNHTRLRSANGLSRKSLKSQTFDGGSSVFSVTDLESTRLGPCLETWALPEHDLRKRTGSEKQEQTVKIKGDVICMTKSKLDKLTKGRSSNTNPLRCMSRETYERRKLNREVLDIKRKTNEKSQATDACQESGGILSLSSATVSKLASGGSSELSGAPTPAGELVLKDLSSSVIAPVGNEEAPAVTAYNLEEKSLPPPFAWVCCDDCLKWRRIPATLIDIVGQTSCKWTCKDNTVKAFADCSIGQEKTNAEINAELGLSDACDEVYYNLQPSSRGVISSMSVDASIESHLTHLDGKSSQPASWTHIKSNLYLHRSRKTQNIDEIMVCNCKPSRDGHMGCQADCLNRVLNIECCKKTCPCGDLCSNQQFQKRSYTKLKRFGCGNKGHGLQLLEDVTQGQFLIEYVGEVLDTPTYESRQKLYAARGQMHFYFMTLNGREIIDACAKGNLGRFINHSCDPNCRTEKWIVNGEVCIGVFALRDIRKGEEVTFDYNYVRVFGAVPKKCFCGSVECRGYIGANSENNEPVVQGDLSEEYFEPLVGFENGKDVVRANNFATDAVPPKVTQIDPNEEYHSGSVECRGYVDPVKNDAIQSVSSKKHGEPMVIGEDENGVGANAFATDAIDPRPLKHEETCAQKEYMQNLRPAVNESMTCQRDTESLCKPLPIDDQMEDFLQDLGQEAEDVIRTPVHESRVIEDCLWCFDNLRTDKATDVRVSITPSLGFSLQLSTLVTEPTTPDSDTTIHGNTPSQHTDAKQSTPKLPKPHPFIMSSTSSGITKDSMTGTKQLMPEGAQKLSSDAGGGQFQRVEKELNKLLDPDGGISRRIGAKGYLKLLWVTQAGDDSGGTSQSIRDLSLILDALLKTKSHSVLVDIINKNGLQMLHKLLKQNRNNFHRIPIIRKLLKIFEFLALKGILTPEHINSGPPASGAESFKDSMLSLTRHNDMQVHRIARNFREKWIPRTIRRLEPSNRDVQLHSQQLHCNWLPSCQYDQGRKDSDAILCVGGAPYHPPSCETQVTEGASLQSNVEASCSMPSTEGNPAGRRKRKSRWDQPSDVNDLHLQTQTFIGDQSVGGKKFMKLCCEQPEPSMLVEAVKNKLEVEIDESSFGATSSARGSIEGSTDVGVPPGFESPLADIPLALDKVSVGCLQERYLPQLSISYGIPMALVQQFGTPEAQDSHGHTSWKIAPGMPFHPYPPLPPYPRNAPDENTISRSANEMLQVKEPNAPEMSALGDGTTSKAGRGSREFLPRENGRWSSNWPGKGFSRPGSNNHRFHKY